MGRLFLFSFLLALAGLFCAASALGFMMGDPKPGTHFDRSPGGWLAFAACVCWVWAMFFFVRFVQEVVAFFASRRG